MITPEYNLEYNFTSLLNIFTTFFNCLQTVAEYCENEIDVLLSVDHVPSNLPPPTGRAKLVVMEDNEAVIKITIKGRSPAMRHVSRTYRVDLDALFERIDIDPSYFMSS